ncbi:MAG: 2-isopropylmalate synthase [Clostridiales bacterium]|nr:2-isopropylmalate synthase [Clostridiales bacterium]MDY4655410.1 2-isopropylmalate synthase [Eubacteriales bacterium]
MRKIKILDTTLRDGEQAPGYSMHASEKLEMSAQLEKLGVDIIEAGFAAASRGDFNSVKEIAEARNVTVCTLSRCKKEDIDAAYEALKNARVTPRIHLFIATSPIHMEYKLKMTEDEVLSKIKESVSYARKFFTDIQFSCEDATRSDLNFLVKAVTAAMNAGATTINIPDTVGYSYPEEITKIFEYLLKNVPDADKVTFSTHCHNDLGLAVANSLAAIKIGAGQLECTVNGIGERAGNASMEEVCMTLKTRRDYYDADTSIITKQIYNTSQLLSSVTGVKLPPTKPLVGRNAFAHESGIHQHGVLANRLTYEIISPSSIGIVEDANLILGKHSGKHAFADYLAGMGIEVGEQELNILFQKFKTIADKKKIVTNKDIQYIISHTNTTQVQKLFRLNNYGITTLKGGPALATITLDTPDGTKAANATGDGPLDAAFKAINFITEREFKLIDWSVNAITEGEDAMGAATLRLAYDGNEVSGRGVSTDTVEASLLAYLNGCNKLFDMVP